MKSKRIIRSMAAAAIPASVALSTGVVTAAEMPSITGSAQLVPLLTSDEFNYMKGITATDFDGTDLTSDIEYAGTVDTTKPGTYPVVYTVTNSQGNTMEATFVHRVQDMTVPTLKPLGPIELKTSQQNSSGGYDIDWTQFFEMSDPETSEADLKASFHMVALDLSKSGQYVGHFSISDTANTAYAEVPITVIDDVKPVITVKDIDLGVVPEGVPADAYKAGIVSIIDANDGDLKGQEAVSSVDISPDNKHKATRYTVTVTDAAGNTASASFVLKYSLNDAPVITGPEEHIISLGDSFDYNDVLTATDVDGDDIELIWLNPDELDANTLGTYNLRFIARDSHGAESEEFLLKVVVQSQKATVRFEPNNGDPAEDIVIDKGTTITPPEITNGDKLFLGWYADSEFKKAFDFTKPITDDVTIYARWEKDITLTFSTTNEPSQQLTVTDAHPAGVTPVVYEKEGYDFVGWKNKFGSDFYDPAVTYTENMVFEAVYKEKEKPPVQYNSVTFKFNNGESDIVRSVEEGHKVDYSPGTPVREGYIFLGWFIGDTAYSPNFVPTKDTVVEAKWEKEAPPIVYVDVTFNPANGNAAKTYKVESGKSLSETVATPVREGYEFLGWFNSNGDKFAPGMIFNTDASFTASWKKIEIVDPDPEPEPTIEFSIIPFNFKNVPVGKILDVFNNGGLFEGYLKVDGENIALTQENLKKYGISLSIPAGVEFDGQSVMFTSEGKFQFVVKYGSRVATANVEVIIPKEQVHDIKARVAEITMFAGQSFDPLSQILIEGDRNVSVSYIDLSTGQTVDLDTKAVPFGKYSVIYTQKESGKQVSITLLAVTPPTNTEGGKPSLLVKDRLIAAKGEKVDLLEFAQAADTNGKNITSSIKVSGEVDWDKVGKYEVVFSVKDSEGRVTEKKVIVEVLEKEDYDAEIAREAGEGVNVQTSDDSISRAGMAAAQAIILGSAATGMLTLVVRRKEENLS